MKVNEYSILENKYIHIFSYLMFISYLLFLFWRLFFYAYGDYYRSPNTTLQFNLIPLKTISSYFRNVEVYGLRIMIINLLGNILAFAPYGFLFPIINKRLRKPSRIMMATFIFSLLVESIQLVLRVGTFDIDDILLNTVGGLIGFSILLLLIKLSHRIKTKAKINEFSSKPKKREGLS